MSAGPFLHVAPRRAFAILAVILAVAPRRGCGSSTPASRTRSASTSRRSSIARCASCTPATGTRTSSTTRRWSSTCTPWSPSCGSCGARWRASGRRSTRFPIAAVYAAGRFVAAAIGVATVWLTYRLGAELSSRRVALLGGGAAGGAAAARPRVALHPHRRADDGADDAGGLAVGAGGAAAARCAPTPGPGAACGLAAAAKYNGGIALVAVAGGVAAPRAVVARSAAQAAAPSSARPRSRSCSARPYTLLDLPAFPRRVRGAVRALRGAVHGDDPAWLLYVKHLSPPGGALVRAARAWPGCAILLLAARRPARAGCRSLLFTLAYFYMLSTHSHVFGRYALPLRADAVPVHVGRASSRRSAPSRAFRRWRGRPSGARWSPPR